MGANYPTNGFDVKDSNGQVFEGQTLTASAQSEWMSFDDAEWFGVAVLCGTVSGTSPTLDITVQCRFDGESDTFNYPSGDNVQTGAALAQMTTTADKGMEYWRHVLPSAGKKGQIRFALTVGGTSPSFEISRFTAWKVERGA